MDRLAELAGYAQSFPGMVDDDFIAAGFTPEEISSYRSQTAPQFEQFAPTGDTLAAPDYTLRERMSQGSQDILSNTFGMDPYRAGVLSRNVLGNPNASRNYGMGLADFTPLGAVFATQEGSRTASRGYEAGDPLQMGLGGLEMGLGLAEAFPLTRLAATPLKRAISEIADEVLTITDSPVIGEIVSNTRAAMNGNLALPRANTPSEAMARDILELRAAGRADEVTDEMMAQADDQYMFANTPLPMDEASRLARASEQEYAGDYFHGSNLGFSQFDKSTRGTFLTDSPAVADSYVGKEGGTIYPALVRGGSDFPVVSGEGRFYSDIPQSALPEELEFMKYDVGSDIPLITDNIVSRAKDERLPGIIFEDIVDRGPNFKQYRGETDLMAKERTEQSALPADVINTFDPATIRSKFARFDPEFKGLRNLSAGVGGVAVLSSIGENAEAGTVTETVSSIKEKYPLFSDIEVRDLRNQGVQDGRRLEFTEAYDDRVDSPLIEIFDPDLQGKELEQAIIGEFLHEAPRRIPEYAELRERLQELKTPQQLQDDMNSYLYDVENYGEDRPFEKWDEVSRKDAFIRGHAVGQWEPGYYTDEQKALIDEMMGLIRSGANK